MAVPTKTRCGRPIVRIDTAYPYNFLNTDRRSKNTPISLLVFDGNRNILPRGNSGLELKLI